MAGSKDTEPFIHRNLEEWLGEEWDDRSFVMPDFREFLELSKS